MESPLTFGVEFEFIIRYRPETYRPHMSGLGIAPLIKACFQEQHKLDVMVRCHVIGILGKCGFLVNPYSFLGEFQKGYDKWGVVPDDSISARSEKSDPRWAGWNFTGVELRTPAYQLCSKAFIEIGKVLHILNRCFDIFVNPSCGLHVHVGHGRAGFPVDTVKNFCSLVTGFERQLNSLHPLDRIQNLFAKPPGRILPSSSPIENLNEIDALGTIPDLVRYFHIIDDVHDSYTAYNLANLYYTDKRTIEFRQHAGTIEPMAVIRWVEVVTGLVSLSHNTPYPAFEDLLQKHVNDPRFSVVKLLHTLNLHDVAEYYRQRGTFNHPPQTWDRENGLNPLITEDSDEENTSTDENSTDPAVLLAELEDAISRIPSIDEFGW